jgi:hypothetical protein
VVIRNCPTWRCLLKVSDAQKIAEAVLNLADGRAVRAYVCDHEPIVAELAG